MLHTGSVWAFAVVISSICSTIVAHFVPVDLERREVCVENTIYLALQDYIYDADPWCRKELGIVDVSSVLGTVTVRTLVFGLPFLRKLRLKYVIALLRSRKLRLQPSSKLLQFPHPQSQSPVFHPLPRFRLKNENPFRKLLPSRDSRSFKASMMVLHLKLSMRM